MHSWWARDAFCYSQPCASNFCSSLKLHANYLQIVEFSVSCKGTVWIYAKLQEGKLCGIVDDFLMSQIANISMGIVQFPTNFSATLTPRSFLCFIVKQIGNEFFSGWLTAKKKWKKIINQQNVFHSLSLRNSLRNWESLKTKTKTSDQFFLQFHWIFVEFPRSTNFKKKNLSCTLMYCE